MVFYIANCNYCYISILFVIIYAHGNISILLFDVGPTASSFSHK